ncbi:MAG: replicative DNA helicase [Firmicutes bacterium]|nr:replicative DNA helicase [Bacillota bacterium]
MENNTKTLPHSLQAEQSVLGCLMLDYVGCGEGFDRLNKADFYSPVHQIIFNAMQELLEKKDKTLDFVTVTEHLSSTKKLNSIGGIEYLSVINDMVPSVSNFRHYFDIVKKNSILRKLNTAGTEIVNNSYASDDEQVTLSTAEKLIFDISRQEEQKELTKLSDELPAVMNRLDAIRKDPTIIYGIETGFNGLDNMTNGLHGGELVILAARPGVGKTSLGLNMIMNAAQRGKKCAVFSLEMSKQSLVTRALSSLAGVSAYRAGRGELNNDEWKRMWQANDWLEMYNIHIDDNSEITPIEIKRKCMRLKRDTGLDFVMVDYLGLMTGGSVKRENRQVEVAANSRAMKVLAKELDIPVLLLSQLNRNVESRNKQGGDNKPALHDLRESGAIEQDADIVLFIHMDKPPEHSEEETDQSALSEAQIIVAKHRNGPCGVVKVDWNRETTTFLNQPHDKEALAARRAAQSKPKAAKTEKPAQKS